MSISYSELARLTCAACGQPFEAEVWTLVDAAERPDLAQALHDNTLDVVTCPHCGASGEAGAPLLYHDPAQRRVYFAAPANVPEYAWRERAQELLQRLAGSLPEELQRPYLGDVQVEQDVAGLRRAVMRRARGTASGRPAVAEQPPMIYRAPVTEAAPEPDVPPATDAEITDAVHNLLAADTPEEFELVVRRSPFLLSGEADALIGQLAEEAYAQGERAVGDALRAVRGTLLGTRLPDTAAPHQQEMSTPPDSERVPEPETSAAHLSEVAYQALLHATNNDALVQRAREYPALLEPWADDELVARAEAVLDEGNERLAAEIDERREALAELRAALSTDEQIQRALRALLNASTEQALSEALAAYPILLADAAQQALTQMAAEARAQHDTTLAEYALECRALLRHIRTELEQ